MTRCKPGDLAMFTTSAAVVDRELLGRVFTVERVGLTDARGVWWTVSPEQMCSVGAVHVIWDGALTPLRGQPEADEIPRTTALPEGVGA